MVHCFFSQEVKEHQIRLLSKASVKTKCCCFMAHIAYIRDFFLQDVVGVANFQVFKGWLLRFMWQKIYQGLLYAKTLWFRKICVLTASCWEAGRVFRDVGFYGMVLFFSSLSICSFDCWRQVTGFALVWHNAAALVFTLSFLGVLSHF